MKSIKLKEKVSRMKMFSRPLRTNKKSTSGHKVASTLSKFAIDSNCRNHQDTCHHLLS